MLFRSHWAVATGLLVGFVSEVSFIVPLASYITVVLLAVYLQRRVWQTPLFAMFLVCFLGTIINHVLTISALRVAGISLPVGDALSLVTMPSILLNLLLAVPVYAVMRDLARWAYPALEFE